jgi:uncharacterized protein (TIGR00251 family)
MAWYRVEEGAVVFAVRLTPKAHLDRIDGTAVLSDGRMVVQVRVRPAPAEGAANEALVALIAKTLRRPKSAIAIVSGATQRVKQLRVRGEVTNLVPSIEAWRKKP